MCQLIYNIVDRAEQGDNLILYWWTFIGVFKKWTICYSGRIFI